MKDRFALLPCFVVIHFLLAIPFKIQRSVRQAWFSDALLIAGHCSTGVERGTSFRAKRAPEREPLGPGLVFMR